MSLERLMREHGELERMARALLAIVDQRPDPELASLILERFALGVRGHFAFEQREVYAPLVESARSDALAIDFRLLVARMERDWRTYMERWTLDAIARDWAGFADTTRLTLADALERMRFESEIVYPLALERGTITPRDAA